MKKLFLSMIMFVMIFSLYGCAEQEQTSGSNEYKIYGISADGGELVAENYTLTTKSKDSVEIVQELLEQLQKTGKESLAKPSISTDKEIDNFQIKETILSIYFTAVYNTKIGTNEVLSRAAIVKTLCQVPGIEMVEFFIEGSALKKDGKEVGLMTADSFVIQSDKHSMKMSKDVTIYFADLQGEKLVPVSAKIDYDATEPIAKILIEELIAGTENLKMNNNNVQSTVPQETAINTITIRNNVCYVDLSKEFENLLDNVSSDVTVYSIVDTLCELPNVSKVQILIDGEPKEQYGDTMMMQKPFERNLDIVKR